MGGRNNVRQMGFSPAPPIFPDAGLSPPDCAISQRLLERVRLWEAVRLTHPPELHRTQQGAWLQPHPTVVRGSGGAGSCVGGGHGAILRG